MRRIISFFQIIIMLVGITTFISNNEEKVQAASAIKIGDYVIMGKYYNEPILWRCVDIDGNGPLMLSDKILSFKPFDAGGNHLYADNTPQATDEYYLRSYNGSNLWDTSNIRAWLNSDANAGEVVWPDGCPPNANNIDFRLKPYDMEMGFLADGNFTINERSIIKPVEQKSLLDGIDATKLSTSGTAAHILDAYIDTILQNYDTAYSNKITDKMFLLDVMQLYKVYQNGSILGMSYYASAKPTKKAIDNTIYTNSVLATTRNWHYWLRSPCIDTGDSADAVRYVDRDGKIYGRSANCGSWYTDSNYFIGVRPAFYINMALISFKSGTDGNLNNPFVPEYGVTNWKIESLDKTSNTVNVAIQAPLQILGNPNLIIGLYDNNGLLIKVMKQSVILNKTNYCFDVSDIAEIKNIKAFLWEDINKITPLTEILNYSVN